MGSSDYATSRFLNALNALNAAQPVEPVEPVQPTMTMDIASPQTGQVPWDTMPANSLKQLYGKMNQGFYTTDSSGHYNSLSRLYRDAEAFLKSQGREPTDQDVYNAMGLIATNAAKQTDSTVADEYFWYDRNIEDWRNEGRPLRPGGTATAEITETILTDDEKRRSQA